MAMVAAVRVTARSESHSGEGRAALQCASYGYVLENGCLVKEAHAPELLEVPELVSSLQRCPPRAVASGGNPLTSEY